MSEIERIQRYIKKNDVENKFRYCMRLDEMREAGVLAQQDLYTAICLIFDYGRAKGYRAAKAEGLS